MCLIRHPDTRVFPRMIALCLLLLLFAACTNKSKSGNSQTRVAPASQGTVIRRATPTPALSSGSQTCPGAIQPLTYWDAIVPTQANVSQVSSVTCGHLKDTPSLQALVTVLYNGTGSLLDVYVYDNLASTSPTQLFKLLNLYKGEAKISGSYSIPTAEVDQHSSVNANKPDTGLTTDLFREFQWSAGAGTFVQVAFPGIFPDLTRYQAEADQAQVNQGYQQWKLHPTATAQALGASLLHWDANAPATILHGGGAHDTQAVVSLKNTGPGSDTMQLTMARLEGNTNGGIWIVTNMATSTLTITSPQRADLLHTPITVTGTGTAFEGVIGTARVLDHLYTDLGNDPVHGASGNGSTTFSTSVTYHSTFTTGAEEGLVMVTAENNAGGATSAAVIVKVLLQ